jgi:hypothetical protein
MFFRVCGTAKDRRFWPRLARMRCARRGRHLGARRCFRHRSIHRSQWLSRHSSCWWLSRQHTSFSIDPIRPRPSLGRPSPTTSFNLTTGASARTHHSPFDPSIHRSGCAAVATGSFPCDSNRILPAMAIGGTDDGSDVRHCPSTGLVGQCGSTSPSPPGRLVGRPFARRCPAGRAFSTYARVSSAPNRDAGRGGKGSSKMWRGEVDK